MEVGLACTNEETTPTVFAMAACNRQSKVGLGQAGGGAPAPWLSPVATALLWHAAGWAWSPSPPVFWFSCKVWLGFACCFAQIRLLKSAFWCFSCLCLQNIQVPKLVENVSDKSYF